jgi:hypothetical protein
MQNEFGPNQSGSIGMTAFVTDLDSMWNIANDFVDRIGRIKNSVVLSLRFIRIDTLNLVS